MKALNALLSLLLLTGCSAPRAVIVSPGRLASLTTAALPTVTSYAPVTILEMLTTFGAANDAYLPVAFEGSFQDQTQYGQNNDVSHEWVLWDHSGHKIPVNNIFRYQGGNGMVHDHDFNPTHPMVQYLRQYGVFVTVKGRYEAGSIDVYFVNDTPVERLVNLAFHAELPA